MNLRQFARGKDCQIRLVGICNADSRTTVLCHWRQIGISGAGLKVPDFMGAHGCSACHAYVDTHKDDATQLAFARAIFRTQVLVIEMLDDLIEDVDRDFSEAVLRKLDG